MLKATFFKKNKRGDTTIPKETVYLVISAVLLVFISVFFYKVYATVTAEKDDGSKTNFLNKLSPSLKSLMTGTSDNQYYIQNYFLGNDKILVGFDTSWDDSKKSNGGTVFQSNLNRPFKCGNSACVCLYNNKWEPADSAKRDQGVMACMTDAFAGKNVVFYSEGGDVEPKTSGTSREDIKGNYLVFYGSLGIPPAKKYFATQRIYMEKRYREGKYYIYISKIDENKADDPANLRKRELDASSA
ncbi:MAG: hypothetical protein AABX32_07520 [Nanoarchaeota archaeon]